MSLYVNVIEMLNAGHIGQGDAIALSVWMYFINAKRNDARIWFFGDIVLELERGFACTHNVHGGPINSSAVGVCDIIGGVKNVWVGLYCIHADC